MAPPRTASGTREDPFDLVIVGGGINGAGVARDAARRGLTVALFEKRDFGTGATANSSGMIHGGIRYLLSDPDVTRLSCADSGYIQKIASHLIFRIPFIFPVLGKGLVHKAFLQLSEVYFEVYDRYQPLKRGLPHSRITAGELRRIEPGITPRALGAVTTDEWGIDSARLNLLNALDAVRAGAEVQTYAEVTAVLRDGAAVRGVRVRDRLAGGEREVYGRLVLNTAGAWSNRFLEMAGIRRLLVRPGKGIHLVYPGRLTNYAVISSAIDGREMFICPHQNETWIGTTDDDYWGDLDDVPVLEDEVRYLVNGIERVLPGIGQYRIFRTMVGCRPTLYAYGPSESKLSREHELYEHSADGAAGLYSMAGGKLASYRVISEEITDALCRARGVAASCDTHREYLPGGEPHDLTPEAFTELGVDGYAAQRILFRHGSQAGRIRELMQREPRTRAVVCPCEPVTEAELRVVMRTEHVRALEDCRRRCRLAMGPCGGAQCAFRAAQIFCEERDLSPGDAPEVARSLAANAWRDRQATLFDTQLAQEEVAQAWIFLSGALGAARTRPVAGGAETERQGPETEPPEPPAAATREPRSAIGGPKPEIEGPP